MGRPAAKLRTLDLFSGGGGNALAFRDFSDVALYCEFADAPLAVLKAAMRRGDIDRAPVHSDVRTLLASKARGAAPAAVPPVHAPCPCARPPLHRRGARARRRTRRRKRGRAR